MRFEVSRTDFQILVSVFSLLDKGGHGAKISRSDIVRESGVCHSHMTKKIRNLYLKEKQLKENIA